MHPFIPFVTEEIWLKNNLDKSGKNYLMFSNWINEKAVKNNEIKNVENIIDFTSSIRSFKNELNISPGSFVDVSLSNIKNKKSNFYIKNENTLKKIARVNNFFNKDLDKPSATMVIGGDIIKVYFEENVDLKTIKDNLIKKQNKYNSEMEIINKRLQNKNFIDRAPKNVVEQEKNNYNNLKNDVKKISLIIQNL